MGAKRGAQGASMTKQEDGYGARWIENRPIGSVDGHRIICALLPAILNPLALPFVSPLGAKRIKPSMVGYPDGCCFSDLHGDMWEKRVHVNECNNVNFFGGVWCR